MYLQYIHRNVDSIYQEALNSSYIELQCDEAHLVRRNRLDEKRQWERDNNPLTQQPAIYIGTIASGDSVIKSVVHQDRIAAQKNIIAFEMEGAGIWDEVSYIMVKGGYDYTDCHKHKGW